MSTRSTTHFIGGFGDDPVIVYRHADGYPAGAGADIYKFFAAVQNATLDTRFDTPSYLSAKYVVYLAHEFARSLVSRDSAARDGRVEEFDHLNPPKDGEPQSYGYIPKDRLDFLSVGILTQDPGDIAYRYVIDCDHHDEHGWPEVRCIASTGERDEEFEAERASYIATALETLNK